MPERRFRPNEVSAGGVLVRPADSTYEACLVSDGHHWGLPKGNIERNETPVDAALREIAEETGVPRDALRLVSTLPNSEYVYRRSGRLIFKRVEHFLVLAPRGAALHPDAAEISEAAWLDFDDAIARASFRDTVTALQSARGILAAGWPAEAQP